MADLRQTYDIAAEQIAQYVQPLWPGSLAMPIESRDEGGRLLSLSDDHISGQFLVLIFCNKPDDPATIAQLKAFTNKQPQFASLNTQIMAISASSDAARNNEIKSKSGFCWPIVSDSTGAVFASYGLLKGRDVENRIVVVTPLRQVRTWFDSPAKIEDTIEVIMSLLENSQVAEEARWGTPHAPVLLVPNVLSPEECGQLIQSFESGGPFTVRPPRPGEIEGNYKIPVYEHNRQDRVDHIIKDKNTLAFLDERIWGRVAPMIKKAFAFDATRREDLHIARYVGKRGGNKMGHRDNTSAATAYRRFALSMNLNDNFEGGEIAFKEYSPKGYKTAPGTAIVFSSSLLHEVLETSKGVRYNLISHFFNEQSLGGK